MILKKIIDYKQQELEHRRRKVSLKDLRHKVADAGPALDFAAALRFPGIRIIAEVKKASPSAGVIRPDFDPLKIARIYEDNGAACLSVLTDEKFFQGSLASLEKIRAMVKVPLLRKDFTLDEYHIYEARAHGADAVLLIARILEDSRLKDYMAIARDLGMSALVEIHDENELDRVKKTGADLIGINNRNLDTLKVDIETSVQLSKESPREATLVSESGISRPDQIKRLTECGINAFLIGESLIRSGDPGRKLREILATETKSR